MVIAMSTITWILFVVIWVALAFWPARVAGRKGHSFFLYFLFSLVFFPPRCSSPTWSATAPRAPS